MFKILQWYTTWKEKKKYKIVRSMSCTIKWYKDINGIKTYTNSSVIIYTLLENDYKQRKVKINTDSRAQERAKLIPFYAKHIIPWLYEKR